MKPTNLTSLTSALALLLVVPGSLRAASESIFPATVAPNAEYYDAPSWELGTIFNSFAPGQITRVRVFSLPDESGDHGVSIWQNSTETLLFSTNWSFGGDNAWITLPIPALRIQANVDYTVSISTTPAGAYPDNSGYFNNPGDNGQHLSYPQGAGVFNATLGGQPTGSYGNSAYLRDIVFQPDPFPFIGIQGNGLAILPGDVTPSLADGTQFGGVKVGSSQSGTFKVVNSGTSNLVFSGTQAVAIAGPSSGDYTVTSQPVSPVVPGGSTTFTIRFAPSAPGVRDATVIIANNARPPYQFAIEGIGMSSGNLVIGNTSEGNATGDIGNGTITGNRYLALRNMRVTAINAKVLEPAGTTANFQCAIYADTSDTNGLAGQFLQGTAAVANPTNGWQTFALTQPVNLGAGSNYWLAIWSDTVGALVYGDVGGVAGQGVYSYGGTWPDPISLAVATPAIAYSIYAEGVPVDDTGPEMYVKGGINAIADGSANVSIPNGTDFAGTTAKSGTRAQTFAIYNVGKADLNLSGTPPVAITGPQAGDFAVTTQPAATIPAGGSTTFAVQFAPSDYAARTATVAIAHTDSPTNAYAFAIQGAGLGGGASVLGNDGQGAYARAIDNTQIHGNRFQAPVTMTISELHAKVLQLTGTFACAIYSDFNGWADHFLQSSLPVVNATNGWNTFPLTAPLEVTAGDYYWLVIWSDTVGALVQADTFGTSYFGDYSYTNLSGEWPDPVVLPGSSQLSFLDAPARTYCIYGEGTALGPQPGPELDLRGAGKLIVAGDTTPSTLDSTDFGSAAMYGSGVQQTFTITNSGSGPLQLTGNPIVTVTGQHARDFTVTSQPASPIPPGAGAAFTVQFNPLNQGLRAATISLANNDTLENPYQFAVQGAGFIAGLESIWPATLSGKDINFDGTVYDLGTIFQASVPGTIVKLRVYSVTGDTGDHTASIWNNADGTVIAGPYTWNYGGVNAWITLDIPAVDIDADTLYTVSISTGTGPKHDYPNLAAGAAAAGSNGQHLSYPANAGVFTTGTVPPEALPTGSYNGGNYLRDIVFVPTGTVVNFPAMMVEGNGSSITNGSASASSANGTDFGQVALGGSGTNVTFTITNTSTGTLHLTATPEVEIGGPQFAEFTVISQPTLSIPAGGTSAFTIHFAPAAAGARSATVSIENDTDAANPYVFAIAGTGGVALRITAVTTDLSPGNVTLQWASQGQQIQVYRAIKVTGPFTPIGAPQPGNSYTDLGILKTNASAFYRIGY